MKKSKQKTQYGKTYQVVSVSLYHPQIKWLDEASTALGCGRSELVQLLIDARRRTNRAVRK